MTTTVIAECGSCHDGDFGKAQRLVAAAAEAGADAAKFQYWSDSVRFSERRHAEAYREVYSKYAVPASWLPELRRTCDEAGVEFACSVYLPGDVWEVAKHTDMLKVASFEAEDPALLGCLRAPLAVGKRVIVSLGLGAGTNAVKQYLLMPYTERKGRVVLLHCVSAYPAPADQLNLAWLRPAAGPRQYDGFSDHSHAGQAWTGALAVAAGATYVERHLRLDDTDPANPDFPHSMDPVGFAQYVANIRFAETCLGDWPFGGPGPMPCEAPMTAYKVKGGY